MMYLHSNEIPSTLSYSPELHVTSATTSNVTFENIMSFRTKLAFLQPNKNKNTVAATARAY